MRSALEDPVASIRCPEAVIAAVSAGPRSLSHRASSESGQARVAEVTAVPRQRQSPHQPLPAAVAWRCLSTALAGSTSTSLPEWTSSGRRLRASPLPARPRRCRSKNADVCSLHFMYRNFGRPHMTLTKRAGGVRATPAMAAGVADHIWSLVEIAALLDVNRDSH